MEMFPEVQEFFKLAEKCKVSMYAVCKRTGTNASTPDRWKHGRGGPSLSKLRQLKSAVIEIARERGTLPLGFDERDDVGHSEEE